MTMFDVVAEPTRRRILDLLLTGELAVGELVAHLAVSQPTVSRHLRVLREAGLVSSRTEAQRRGYKLNAAPPAQVDPRPHPYRPPWARRPDPPSAHPPSRDGP